MQRYGLSICLCAGLLMSGPAAADDLAAGIVAQLRAQGFTEIAVHSTLLGRVRIEATKSGGEREIIMNPGTGEILRDLWQPSDAEFAAPSLVQNRPDKGDVAEPSSGSDGSGKGDGSDKGRNAGQADGNSGNAHDNSGSEGGNGTD